VVEDRSLLKSGKSVANTPQQMDGRPNEFERKKRDAARSMSDDKALVNRAMQVLVDADRHNYTYQWSWLGLPIIQIPEDIVVLQELVWETRPTLIVETGIARGGSLIFFSSLLEMIGEGSVIGVDVDIRPDNRASITAHPLSKRIQLIEGSSTDPRTVERVKSFVRPGDRVMIVLDSNHTHAHVIDELRCYAPLVTIGQVLVVADTILEYIPYQSHRPRAWGPGNNPMTALQQYLSEDGGIELDEYYNNKLLLTTCPRGYLRRLREPTKK
jgi:cephalosporin hydroxylase